VARPQSAGGRTRFQSRVDKRFSAVDTVIALMMTQKTRHGEKRALSATGLAVIGRHHPSWKKRPTRLLSASTRTALSARAGVPSPRIRVTTSMGNRSPG